MGIGILLLLLRPIPRAGKIFYVPIVLTVISPGHLVALAYTLSAIPAIGMVGIWWSVPIGWLLADVTGIVYYRLRFRKDSLLTAIPTSSRG